MSLATALHPRNHGFRWEDHDGPLRRVTPDAARQFDEQGFVLLEGLLDAASVEVARDAIDPIDEETNRLRAEAVAGEQDISRADAINFSARLVAQDPRIRAFATAPALVEVAIDLVGPDLRLYWDQLVYKRPGTSQPFPWHQDTAYAYTEPQHYLTCWVALVDATVENGCPWVEPGTHRQGTLAHRWEPGLGWVCKSADEGGTPVEARVGDVVAFSSLTPHRTGPNLSPAMREAYILQYAAAGTRVWPGDDEPHDLDHPQAQFVVAAEGSPV